MKRLSKRESGQQKRLHEQLDFFGAKKKRFISVYANKPRIRIKQTSVKKPEIGIVTEIDYNQSRHEYLERLFLSRQRLGLAQGQMMANQQQAFGMQGLQSTMGIVGGLGAAGLQNLAAQGALYGRRLY